MPALPMISPPVPGNSGRPAPGGGGADAHLFSFLPKKNRAVPFSTRKALAPRAPLLLSVRRDNGIYLGLSAVGDKLLGAVYQVAALDFLGGSADGAGVACPRMIQLMRRPRASSPRQYRQVLFSFVLRAVIHQGVASQGAGGITDGDAAANPLSCSITRAKLETAPSQPFVFSRDQRRGTGPIWPCRR